MSFLSALVVTQTIGWPEVLLRVSVAAVLGGAIGLERELRERSAPAVVAGVDGALEVRWTE